jgi:hypothetical protein
MPCGVKADVVVDVGVDDCAITLAPAANARAHANDNRNRNFAIRVADNRGWVKRIISILHF